MRKIRMHPFAQSFGLLLLGLALGSGPALARHHGDAGHMGHGYSMHHGMWGKDMFAYVPKAILFQKDLLKLSKAQVQKIEAIKQEMHKAGGNHEAMEKIHEQMELAIQGGNFDLSTYESALKKAADYAVKARTETARKAQDALKVLNDDQRTRFLYSMEVIHEWMEMRGMHHHKHKMDKKDTDEADEHEG